MRTFTATCIFMATLGIMSTTDAICYDNADCAPSGCCTLGRIRYPTPTCNDLQKEGERCMPNQKPFSTTGTNPDGSFWYNVTNAYDLLCPCAPGLICSEGSCKKEH